MSRTGERAPIFREKRYEALDNVIKKTNAAQPDFVLIAGDTFDAPDIDELVLKRTVDALNRIEAPVYVLPGNHDPFIPGGIWSRNGWRRIASHVHLCASTDPILFSDKVTIYPCPILQKTSRLDPTESIPPRAPDDTRFRIGFAHGSIDRRPEMNFPIASDRAEQSGLDYLALGDWHSPATEGLAHYPGTIEATGFDETNPGHILVVELDAPGQLPRTRLENVNTLDWRRESPCFSTVADIETFDASLPASPDIVLRLAPTLAPPPQCAQTELDALIARLELLVRDLESRLLFVRFKPLDLSAVFSAESALDLPPGILQDAADLLRDHLPAAESVPPTNEASPLHKADPASVAEAFHLLGRLARQHPGS